MFRAGLLSGMALCVVSCAQFKASDTVQSEGTPPTAQEAQVGSDVSDPEILARRALAEQGDAKVQFSLGEAYERGFGVPKDPAEAVRWYRLAAEQRDPVMLFQVGNKLWEGGDVPKNEREALWCWTLAAEQEFAPAQARLGRVLSTGSEEIVINKVEAYIWLSLASKQGDQEAKKHLQLLEKRLQPRQTAEARRLLQQWKPARMISVVRSVSE